MTTAKQLWLGFGTLLALLLITSLISALRLRELQKNLSEIIAVTEPASAAAAKDVAEKDVRTVFTTLVITLLASILIGGGMAVVIGRRIVKTESTLRVTLSSIGDAVVLTDAEGRVSYLNPVAQALTGWSREEALAKPLETVLALVNEETRRPIENPVQRVLRHGASTGPANHTLLARDGTERPIDDSAAPIQDAQGRFLGVVLIFRDGTERRRAELALRGSEARKAAMLEAALDAVITIDHEGRVVEFNPAAETMFGYSQARAIGQELAQLVVPPGLRELHRQSLRRCVATGESTLLGRRFELSALRADGSEFPVELAITRIPLPGPPLFTAYLRDISGRKQSERRVAAQYAVTRILAKAASVSEAIPWILQAVCECLEWGTGAVWTVDRQAGVLRCVATWHLSSVQAPEFLAVSQQRTFDPGVGLPGRVWTSGEPAWIVDVAQDANFPRGPLAARAGLHSAFGFPIRLGKQILGVIEFFSHEIRQPDKDLLEMMDAIGSQIGQFVERKRAEEAVRESEQWLRQLADAMPQIVWSAQPDGSFDYYNRRWYEFTGLLESQASADGWQPVLHPDDVPPYQKNWSTAVKSGKLFQIECRFKDHKTGGYLWHLCRGLPIRDRAGRITRWYGTCTDVDHQKRTEEALVTTDRRKDEFLAVLSHELRNPLAPIRNALHMLRLGQLDDEDLMEARDVIDRQVQQLAGIVDDLLDVFRISHEKMHLHKEPLDLARLVRQTAEDHRSALEGTRLNLRLETSAEPVWVYGDRQRLCQAVTNLLSNAAKYSNPGDQVTVRVEVDAPSQRAVVSVRDTGIGIAPELLPHIFETFIQGEQSLDRRRGGLGLGLPLVKGIIELHGGTVKAQSAGLGQGTELILCLPLGEKPKARAKAPVPVASPRHLRILIVEDNLDAARSLAKLLKRYGHEVTTAHTGPAGVQATREWRPEVVLCDLGLPEMDGYGVARTLRGDPSMAEIRLIAVSGYGQEEDRRRSEEAGFDLHLTKPVDPMELQRLLTVLKVGP